MRPSSVRHAVLVLAVALVPPASAQGARDAARDSVRGIPAGCTYATCALRVEPRFFFAPQLVRGPSGEPVGHLGFLGGDVDLLLAGPDSAARYAREYVKATRTASVLALIGTIAYVVAVSQDNRLGDASPAVATTAIVGVGFSIASIPYVLRAGRSLSRSLWWYNAALPR